MAPSRLLDRALDAGCEGQDLTYVCGVPGNEHPNATSKLSCGLSGAVCLVPPQLEMERAFVR
jgi:hypothetical protein